MQGYIERTIASLVAASERAAIAEQVAFSQGVLQRVDPRVKVAGLFALIVVVAASRRLSVIAALFVVAAILAAAVQCSDAEACRVGMAASIVFHRSNRTAGNLLDPGKTDRVSWRCRDH